jgi:hypothetical protein
MTQILSAQQARETKIFVIENEEITETTLFDHVCESAEETTSPRGVMTKLFIQEKDVEVKSDDIDGHCVQKYDLRIWESNGCARVIDTYDTEEEAQDEWYTRTYNHDFLPDDQRDTMYWNTREEAEAELNERMQNQ